MTSDKRAALVERLALVYAKETGCGLTIDGEVCLCDDPRIPLPEQSVCGCRMGMPVALDLALEEAAKVADRYEIPMAETSASHIAAAIRALKGKA